jgi:hypothetical protein
MKSSLKLALSAFAALLAAPFASAQVLIHDFSAFESPNTFFVGDWELNGDTGGTNSPRATFSQGAGFYNFVGGSNDDASMAFYFFTSPVDITGFNLLEISARLVPGNTAPKFTIALFDSVGHSAEATFDASPFATPGFFTINTDLRSELSFNPADVSSFMITGNDPGGTATLSLSVDQISITAVPEPSTYGIGAAVILASLVALRRRQRQRQSA